jgi:hypothetical protein
VIIKQEQLKQFRKSDGDIVPKKESNVSGGKVITITAAV